MTLSKETLGVRSRTALVLACLLGACASESSGDDTSGDGSGAGTASSGETTTGPASDGSDGSDAGGPTTGPDIETGSDCEFDDSIVFDRFEGTVLQLESADGNTCIRLERREEAQNESDITWALIEVWVGELGSIAHIDDQDALCWHMTHHNWTDRGSVWTGRTHWDLTFDQEEVHGAPVTYELQAFASGPIDPANTNCVYQDGDGPLADPIELLPYSP